MTGASLPGSPETVPTQRQADGSWLLRSAAAAEGSISWRHDGRDLHVAAQPADLARLAPPAPIHWEVLKQLLALEFPAGTDTPFVGVHRLPAGMECRVESDGTVSQLRRAWTLAGEPFPSNPEPDLWDALVAQCSVTMEGARRSAVLLSGGLDSSVIAAAAVAAARKLGQPVPLLLSAAYPGLDCDESPAQLAVAGHLSAPHHTVNAAEIAIWPAGEEGIRESLHPLVDGQEAINIALYRVARAEGCDLVLTGVGGDELFEGRGLEIDLVRSGRWLDAAQLIHGTLQARPQPRLRNWLRRSVRLPLQPTRSGSTWRDRDDAGSWCRAILRRTLAGRGLSWRLEMGGRTVQRAGLAIASPFLGNRFLTAYQEVASRNLLEGGKVKGLLRKIATAHLPSQVIRKVEKANFSTYYNHRLQFDRPAIATRYDELRRQHSIPWLPNELNSLFQTPIAPARFLTGWMAYGILQFADIWSAQSRRQPDGISE